MSILALVIMERARGGFLFLLGIGWLAAFPAIFATAGGASPMVLKA